MALKLPKSVEISNPQINRLYQWLTILVGVYLAYEFFFLDKYAASVEIGQYVSSDLWVEDLLTSEQKKAKVDAWPSEWLCTDAEKYDYHSVEGPWYYANHSCLLPCPNSTVSVSCLSPVETYLNVESSDVFIGTQMKETTYRSNGDVVTQQYVMPMAEDMGVSFSYSMLVREAAIRASLVTGPWDWRDFTGFSALNITTVILNRDRVIAETLPPAYAITLSVPRLLELAGMSDLLDAPQPDAGANTLKYATYTEGPIGRITGRELTLGLNCYNHWGRPSDVDGLEKIEGFLCTVEVRASSQPWETVERLAEFNDESHHELRHRIYHGIRVNIEAGGEIRCFDVNALMAWIVGAVVLLGIPQTLVLLFSTSMLGHTSTMYKRVIYERFDIGEQTAGLVTRMMTNGVAFLELEDMQNGVSFKRMNERLREALKHESDELDDLEISQLVDFCFNAVVSPNTVCANKSSLSVLKGYFQGFANCIGRCIAPKTEEPKANSKSSRARLARTKVHEHITIDDFLVSCASCDRVGFNDVVTLFDSNRKMSWLERFFMPRYIKKNVMDRIAAVRKARSNPAASVRGDLKPTPVAEADPPPAEAADEEDMTVEELLGDKVVPEGMANEALWHLSLEERKEVLNMSHFKVEELYRKGERLETAFENLREPHAEDIQRALQRLADREHKIENLVQRLTGMMGSMGASLETTISKLGRCTPTPRSPRSEVGGAGDVVGAIEFTDRAGGISAIGAASTHTSSELQEMIQHCVREEIECCEVRSQQRESEIAKSLNQTFDVFMQRLGRIEQQSGSQESKMNMGEAAISAAAESQNQGADGINQVLVHVHGKFMEMEQAVGSRLVELERKVNVMAKSVACTKPPHLADASHWRQAQGRCSSFGTDSGGNRSES